MQAEQNTQNKLKIFLQVLIGIGLAVVCVLLYPKHTSNFKYYFELGKPWTYGLLTAEEDFPIYKAEPELEAEQAALLARTYTPYYSIDDEIGGTEITKLLSQSALENSPRLSSYLKEKLEGIYAQGIISFEDVEHISKEGYNKITILNTQHVGKQTKLEQCYTPRTAYDLIIENAPLLAENRLKNMELNNYLVPNLLYDSVTSRQVKENIVAQVSITRGMVQQGEKIVDRGEIIDENIYLILSSLKRTYDEKTVDNRNKIVALVGDFMLIFLLIVGCAIYLVVFRKDLLVSVRNILFFAIVVLVMVLMSFMILRFTTLSIYLVPLAWGAILTRVFFDSRTAFMLHLLSVLIVAPVATQPLEFIILELGIGLVAISGLKDMTQRSKLARTSIWIILTYSLLYTGFVLSQTGDITMVNPYNYLAFLINGGLVLFAYGFIYLIEYVFGFTSSLTLVEITNVNSELLLDFAERAPGTFQHAMQVSNLATEAAKAIGAKSLLVRAGAMYHDIGKMNNPQCFTENQLDGVNPLKQMSYVDAAQVIISHVSEGLKIAKKHKLPKEVTQFIATHHGTSKVRYFYNSYVNEHPEEKVDESLFTYPGPIPCTKETAILMMADAVEARSRSLKEFTEDSIRQMVSEMIDMQIADGQFKQTPLSFKDVEDIKNVFVERLITMNHHRISYPELQKREVENNKNK